MAASLNQLGLMAIKEVAVQRRAVCFRIHRTGLLAVLHFKDSNYFFRIVRSHPHPWTMT